uniref:DALR anticodon-binding domain-containing protein 3-like n=1 Tax=Oncorhynchus gorbuscha TaxID=8017 RepID=UPI001EAED60B|nr:DALR anticodon-binding domain-containing protein 3-like [Oncorhynchus gorbuscha]
MTRGRRTFWRLYRIPHTEKERRQMEEEESKGKNTDGDKEEMLRVNLKRVFQEEQLPGYDPSLGSCTVQRDSVSYLAQLDRATAVCTGEWLLLFDYLIPFSELLDQTGQTLGCDGGARVNLKTEWICKFLVSSVRI